MVRWFGTNTDVTDRREVGERLRESEDNYRHAVDHIDRLLSAYAQAAEPAAPSE